MRTETIRIEAGGRRVKCLVLRPAHTGGPLPGILWIHGGGYMLGMAGMVHASCGKLLARRFGAVVISPGYTLAFRAPYPAALEDCYAALDYLWTHAAELGVDPSRIIVGGESAGGGLAAAVCLLARDRGRIPVALQLPLYPMLDCEDMDSSRDNHGRVWNTRRNHWGWRHYLGPLYGTDRVPAYASPARATDLRGMPPCCTFVCEGEPFYRETLDYAAKLRAAGVDADVDVYPGNTHAFDLLCPWRKLSRAAKETLCRKYAARMAEKEKS